VFVVEFENEDDRLYYLDKDPAHLEFKTSIGGVVAKAQVVDFIPGIFNA
jgi:Stress responsive A/B Barrel Domain